MAMVVFGANGGLGRALTNELRQRYPQQTIFAVSRGDIADKVPEVNYVALGEYSEENLDAWLQKIIEQGHELTGVVSTVGLLHNQDCFPEKKLGDIDAECLQQLFQVNAVIPMLLLKHCGPKFAKKSPGFFVQLSAKVGSIEDNYLGGWYSYRASKAALNMLLKTAAIELKRTHERLVVAAIHPGTTDTELSSPFQARIPQGKLYSPERSAKRIVSVIDSLSADQSGQLFHWDGQPLPY